MNKFKSVIAIFILLLCLIGITLLSTTGDATDDTTDPVETVSTSSLNETEIDSYVYPHDEVIDVNIVISDSNYQDLLDDALDETYYLVDITYNGYTLTNVALRAKGNSSLTDAFNDGDGRFSFNIDLNYYVDQDLFGIDKLILNNLYMDPTMMAEYIGYEAFDSLDAVSSKTTFTALYINDEYFGLYLSVENVGNEFLEMNYGDSDGSLYKPEIMGVGADLNYINDDGSTYTALIDDNEVDLDNEAIVNLMKALDTGEDLESILDVDSFLKYLAISTFTVHLDSYQNSMFHNYYLYNDDGIFQWIPWDLNMIFDGFPGGMGTDAAAVEFLIDEPVTGSMSSYPIVEAVLANDTYMETYHDYLQELMDNYFDTDAFEQRVLEIYQMINSYVQTDPSSSYTYAQFQDSLFTDTANYYSLTTFVEERSENVTSQLSGEIPSTNNGLGNTTSGTGIPGGGQMPGGGVRPGGQPPITQTPAADTTVTPTDVIDIEEIAISVVGLLSIGMFIYYMKRKML